MRKLQLLQGEISSCQKCPRLVKWCQKVAKIKRPAYSQDTYWGKPVPSFGDDQARLLIVGLAPGAHGANRTGRMFTGDRSGDWLYRALFQTGFANKPHSTHREDGLVLSNAYVSAVVHCAPPGNKPTNAERDRCIPYLFQELDLLNDLKVIVCLGKFAWDGMLKTLSQRGYTIKPKPVFKHGAEVKIGPYFFIGSFHPSQQNTFTKRLTEPMLRSVFEMARKHLHLSPHKENKSDALLSHISPES